MKIIALGDPPTPYIYEEGMHYNWDKTGNVLQLVLSNPSPREINAIRTGNVSFNLVTYPECLFLLVQFEGMPWWDAPYSWWIVPENQRIQPPELKKNESLPLAIILIDAYTGIVKTRREITLPKLFSEALIKAVKEQIQNPVDSNQYNQRIDQVYRTYSFPAQMLENALLK